MHLPLRLIGVAAETIPEGVVRNWSIAPACSCEGDLLSWTGDFLNSIKEDMDTPVRLNLGIHTDWRQFRLTVGYSACKLQTLRSPSGCYALVRSNDLKAFGNFCGTAQAASVRLAAFEDYQSAGVNQALLK
jgi:hypothetical protein